MQRHSIAGLILAAASVVGCTDPSQVLQPSEAPTPPTAFAIVPQATAGYLNETSKIDISSLADGTVHNSISDVTQTVTFSTFLAKRSVPTTWATWGSPPYTESSTPDILVPQISSPSLIMTLAQPSPVFGFEVMAVLTQTYSFTALFFAGNTLVESITQDVPAFEARLFAASVTQPITRAIIFINENPPPSGFAIAQVRYGAAADVQVTIDGRGNVDRATGEALVTGTISCARPVSVSFEVTLSQTQKIRNLPTTVAVTESLAVSCGPGGSFQWSALLTPANGQAFEIGAASASIQSVTPLMTPVAVSSSIKLDWAKK